MIDDFCCLFSGVSTIGLRIGAFVATMAETVEFAATGKSNVEMPLVFNVLIKCRISKRSSDVKLD